ncbi:MAG: hypothetical protein ACRDRN_12315 [Sciscionella sp.]
MDTVCADCTNEIDHCHGTLVIHGGGLTECHEPECANLDPARHALRIDCHEVDRDCYCGANARTDVLRRAS